MVETAGIDVPLPTCRIVNLTGEVSEEIYQIETVPNTKNIAILLGPNRERYRVHKDKMVPIGTKGQIVAFEIDGHLTGICPGCGQQRLVQDGDEQGQFIECDCVRQKTTVTSERMYHIGNQNGMNEDNIMSSASEVAVPELDFEVIKAAGAELWRRGGLGFDHPGVDVVAYALLATDPDRKLCFQTYNGRLGKDGNLERLCLEQFTNNQTHPTSQKQVGHLVKHGLEKERAKLQKAGYQQI